MWPSNVKKTQQNLFTKYTRTRTRIYTRTSSITRIDQY